MTTPLLDVDEALRQVVAAAPPPRDEAVPIEHAIGRILREPVIAPHPFPRFARAEMDGFAVRARDLRAGELAIAGGESAAGAPTIPALPAGHALPIYTGAPLPDGADAVVPRERATVRDGERLRVDGAVTAGDHVTPAGREVAAGAEVLAAGARLGPADVGAAAACGRVELRVARTPSLCVVATGDELIDAAFEPAAHQQRGSNDRMLVAMARAAGLTRVRRRLVGDHADALHATLAEALVDDLVITTGGVGRGRRDRVPDTLTALGVEPGFHGVAQAPGRPLWFGWRGATAVLGSPGRPLAALVTFAVYARSWLAAATGDDGGLPWSSGTLAAPLRHAGRGTLWALVRAQRDDRGVRLTPTGDVRTRRSLFGAAGARGLVRVEPGARGLDPGERVAFLAL